ncbi:MAG: hypothetical protein OHK0029_34480 [Armatimonadaceae bacterium]
MTEIALLFPFSPLNWASLWYGMGYAVGVLVFAAMAWRRGFALEPVVNLGLVGLIGGLLGANLTQLLFGGAPGKTVVGGIAVGYLCVALYKWRAGIHRPTGDLFAVALMAGEAVGRWGCFAGGCCYGKPSALPWAIWQQDALRHPTQAYLALAALAILVRLLWQEFRRPLPENGLFYLQGVLYCTARFAIEFFRDGAGTYAGLTVAQWVCIGGAVYFAVRGGNLQRTTAAGEAPLGQTGQPGQTEQEDRQIP